MKRQMAKGKGEKFEELTTNRVKKQLETHKNKLELTKSNLVAFLCESTHHYDVLMWILSSCMTQAPHSPPNLPPNP